MGLRLLFPFSSLRSLRQIWPLMPPRRLWRSSRSTPRAWVWCMRATGKGGGVVEVVGERGEGGGSRGGYDGATSLAFHGTDHGCNDLVTCCSLSGMWTDDTSVSRAASMPHVRSPHNNQTKEGKAAIHTFNPLPHIMSLIISYHAMCL